ncbi:MAG: hypothetical protein HDS64_11925 [Bacteroidales bacterium]|nr:hypothetical protein [Bacteroidales bacterium]
MIKLEKLYAATDDGLDIITLHYPDAANAAKTGRPFRMRGERTPSAYVKKFRSKQGFDVWKLTDFGDEGHAKAPIDIHMEQCNLNFAEAVIDLASTFGISDELNKSVNRPVITKEAAGPDMKEGELYWEIDQEFSPEECETMGPRVTKDDLVAMHWYRAKYVARVTKDRELIYNYSNENYPIFIRECWFKGPDGKQDRFYKIYKPKEVEKQYRFSYYPRNKKPQQYTNGLFELETAWKRYNENVEKNFNQDPANEGQTFKPEKFPEAIICSGERDSMCAKALGFWPLWFNSETYKVSDREYSQITRMVETVYNIPDIDSTGLLKGREMAMRFIDIHTIWLPASLSERKDHRGRPRKDFRDWCELYSSGREFDKLMAAATPAKFWYTTPQKKGDDGVRYKIDPECLRGFLSLSGFKKLKDPNSTDARFIRIDGNVVSEVKVSDMKSFTHRWSIDNGLPRPLRNVITTSPYFSPFHLDVLPEVDLDFSTCTQRSQLFHFRNAAVDVTAGGMRMIDTRKESIGRYVWDSTVVPHDIRFLPEMFTISHKENSYSSEDFDIEIHNMDSKYFRYLINSSRLYWRKEMEYRFGEDIEARKAYQEAHPFDIAGEGLDYEEIREQKRSLISKIFAIGYMLHRYKDKAKPWAPFVMDNLIGDNDQCNGGSGKSIMFDALRNLVRGEIINGRNPKLLENKFLFERVDRFTDFVCFDDCAEGLDFGQFYNIMSSDLLIDAKNIKSYTLKYREAPKFAFTTNYVPRELAPSTVRRMIAITVSDYYHQSTDENDYIESRSIRDDFGKTLFDEEYSEKEWSADYNFMLQCVRFYLSLAHLSVKIEPNIKNIIFRKYMREMSDNFRNWAEFYFSEEGDNLDRLLVKEEAFNAYKAYSGVARITMQKFKKSLIGFCYTCDWVAEFNPEVLQNSSGRILKRVKASGSATPEQKEMIYVRSRKAAEAGVPVNDSADKVPLPLSTAFPAAPASLSGHQGVSDYDAMMWAQLEEEKKYYSNPEGK